MWQSRSGKPVARIWLIARTEANETIEKVQLHEVLDARGDDVSLWKVVLKRS